MKIRILVYVFCLSKISFAQIGSKESTYLTEINDKNLVFRLQGTGPIGISLNGNAELKLLKPLSLNLNIGSIYVGGTRSSSSAPNQNAPSTVGFLSIEPRLYFNLGYRKKMNRNIKNFSGNYIALKYFLSTPPISSSSQDYNFENTRAYQIHIGTQHQVSKHVMVGANIGWVLYKEAASSSHSEGDFPILQFGATLGYVF